MLAGPGTGKTETLTERITHFIRSEGLLPNQVLMFTYTNKASSNMSQRIRNKIDMNSELHSGTFHSLCYRLMRQEICPKGVLPEYKVLPEHHAGRLRREAAEEYINANPGIAELLREAHTSGAAVLELYERRTKLNLQPKFLCGAGENVLRREQELTDMAEGAAQIYSKLKARYQVFDFNDILFQFMQTVRGCEDVRQSIQYRFPHVYVDEYQDTNRVQVSILQLLTTPNSFLTVVGDDTQSIYSFQGSQVENIRNFGKDFDDVDVVVLNENYRSSPPMVAYVNAINATCQGALTKTLVSRGPRSEIKPRRAIFPNGKHEAEWIVKEIQHLVTVEQLPMSEIVVLSRIGRITANVETALQRADIPYTREGGIKFVDLKHIQLFISFLELLENPYDWLAWEVMLPAIPNIGDHLTQVIIKDLQSNEENWTWKQPPVFSLGRGKRWESLMNFWRDVLAATEVSKGSVKGYLEQVLPFFQKIYARYFHVTPRMVKVVSATQLPDRMEDHMQDIRDYIIELSSSYIGLVKDFISEVVSSQDQRERRRGITLSTIHSAKGLEWSAVFVMANTENVFPFPGFGLEPCQLEEERRLYYVACSRAKTKLYLTGACTYDHDDFKLRGRPSRFAEDPATAEFVQRVKELGHDPFHAQNPHRIRDYFLVLPADGQSVEAMA